ncbi:MAG: hypothetical protein KDC67_02950 [Ignavibacteriae bacterium]|nr:hypothetical protein [Ignavibacteriota bacterium]
MSDNLKLYRDKITSFQNIVLIFIDNEESVLSDAKKILNDNWPDFFKEKKYFLEVTKSVKSLIEEHGEENCIVICDKNLDDVKGEKFVIELREKFPELLYIALYTAELNKELRPLLEMYEVEYIFKTPEGFSDLMLKLNNDLISDTKTISLDEVFSNNKSFDMTYDDANIGKKDNTIVTIFRASVSHLDESNKIIELRIQNPNNQEQFAYKTFPTTLFDNVENIAINQIFKITEKISGEGSIKINFEDTKQIEPESDYTSKWSPEIKNALKNIPKL